MTEAVGQLLSDSNRGAADSPAQQDMGMGMEMTEAVGQLLSDSNRGAADSPVQQDMRMGMEMTEAVGQLLSNSNGNGGEESGLSPLPVASVSAPEAQQEGVGIGMMQAVDQAHSPQMLLESFAAADNGSSGSTDEPTAKRARVTPKKNGTAHAQEDAILGALEATEEVQNELPADDHLEAAMVHVSSCTLKDFLALSKIRFLDKVSSKRRTTMCIAAPKPEALDEKLLVGTTLKPYLDTLEQGCQQLTRETKEMKQTNSVQEAELNSKNPPLFETMQVVEDEDLDLMKNQMKELKNDSRQKAKTKWHIWRANAIEAPISQSLAARKEMMMNDQIVLASTKKTLSVALANASKMKSSLLANIAQCKAQLLSTENELAITTSKRESAKSAEKLTGVAARQEAVHAEQLDLNAKAASLQKRGDELAALHEEALAEVEKASKPATAEEVKRERRHYDVTRGVQLWTLVDVSETCLSFNILRQYRFAINLEETSESSALRTVTAASLELPASIAGSEQLASLFDASHIDLSAGCQKVLEAYTALVVRADAIVRDIETMSLFNTVELENAASAEQQLLIKLKFSSYTRKARFQLIFSVGLSGQTAVPTCSIEGGAVLQLSEDALQALVGECPSSVAGWMCTAQSKVQEFISSPP